MKCKVCNQSMPMEISGDDKTAFQPFTIHQGLPQPSCGYCFDAMDYSVKSVQECAVKSLAARVLDDVELEDPAWTRFA